MSASERHNQLVQEFVMKAGRATANQSELMVVLESTILASMLLLSKVHGVRPSVAAGLVEAAVQRGVERFAEQERG